MHLILLLFKVLFEIDKHQGINLILKLLNYLFYELNKRKEGKVNLASKFES